jgi:hypothetical protein
MLHSNIRTQNGTETTGAHTIELLKCHCVIFLFALPLYKKELTLRTVPSVANSETLHFINLLHKLFHIFPPQETPLIFPYSINRLEMDCVLCEVGAEILCII